MDSLNQLGNQEQQNESNFLGDSTQLVLTVDPNYSKVVYLRWGLVVLAVALCFAVYVFLQAQWQAIYTYSGLVFSVIVVLYTIYLKLKIKSYRYELQEDAIYVKQGVLVITEQYIPFNRVQHVVINQGAFSRIWNLAQLEVFAAGNQGGDLYMPGLQLTQAESWKEMAIDQIKNRPLLNE